MKKNTSSDYKKIKNEPWPGRYCVSANGIFKYKAKLYSTLMYMASHLTEEETRNLMFDAGYSEPIKGKDFINLLSQMSDTFSEQEADELVTFLNSVKGFKAAKLQAKKPRKDTPGRLLYVIKSCNGLTMRELSKEDAFSLDFEVDVFIDLSDCKKINRSNILIREIMKRLTRSAVPLSKKPLKMVIDLTEEIDILNQLRTVKEKKQEDR